MSDSLTQPIKYLCTVCGAIFDSDEKEPICPVCGATYDKLVVYSEEAKEEQQKESSGKVTWRDEHHIGVAKNASKEIQDGIVACFKAETLEVGMYSAMARQAYREGYPEIGLLYERVVRDETDHAARFCEMLGRDVSTSTKANLKKVVMGESGACKMRFDIAATAKRDGHDALHDSIHEICRDEARHGKAFNSLLKKYFDEEM